MSKRTKSLDEEEQSAAVEATRLLGKWMRIAQGHVAFGSGCSCGLGVASVRTQDFEQHILDFLHSRHGDDVAIAALMRDEAGYRESEAGSVAQLLRALVKRALPEKNGSKPALLVDLARSIDSFDDLHRGR